MRRMNKGIVGMVTGFALLLGACGGVPASTTASSDAPTASSASQVQASSETESAGKEAVTLTMWSHDTLYPKFFTERAEEWAEQYPQYEFTFDFQQVPDVWTKLLNNLAAGEEVPDLVGLEQGQFPAFMKDNILEDNFVDLSAFIADERDQFVEGRWVLYESNDKVYGVETALSTVAYYYQPEVFEQAGLEIPFKTWDEFKAAGQQLAQNGVAIMPLDTEGDTMFNMLFLQRGGQYFDEAGAFVLGASPNREYATETMEFLKDGLDTGVFWGGGAADFWGPPIYAAYQEGKLAGAVMPDWYSDFVLKAQAAEMAGKWRITDMPRWQAGGHSTTVNGGTGIAITKRSKHVDLAWDLLHYAYMTEENQVKRFLELGYYPHMLTALQDPRVTQKTDPYFGDQAIGAVFAATAEDAPVWYQSPLRTEMQTELGTQLTRFYAGEIGAAEALDQVIAKINEAAANN